MASTFEQFQALLDGLDQAVATKTQQLQDAAAKLVVAQTEADALRAQLADANSQNASLQVLVSALNKQVADLQAQLAAYQNVRPTGAGFVGYETLPKQTTMTATLAQVPAGTQVTFDTGSFTFSGFDTNGYGVFPYGLVGFRGNGRTKTLFSMVPKSSTSASRVPAQSTKSTNPLWLFRFGGNSSKPVAVKIDNLTINGTDQGHLYNGMQLYWATGSTVDKVSVTGIPGDNSANPGETFSIGTYNGNNLTFTNCDIDGRDATGKIVGASGIGLNFNQNVTITDSVIHHRNWGAAVTAYKCSGELVYRNLTLTDNALYALNFEENSNGNVTIDKCNFVRTGNSELCVDSSVGSLKVTIIDPIFDGPKLRIKVHADYNGLPQKQLKSDIVVIVNGVARPDLIQWLS